MKKRNVLIAVAIVVVAGAAVWFSLDDGIGLQGRLSAVRLTPWAQNFDPNPNTTVNASQEKDFKWNYGMGINRNLTLVKQQLCFEPVNSNVFSCFDAELSNHYKMDNLDWTILRSQLYGDQNAQGGFKLDWYAKLTIKRTNGSLYFVKSSPWRVYLETSTVTDCQSPLVLFEGQCVDPIPNCQKIIHDANFCIDRIMDINNDGVNERVDHYNFICYPGWTKVDTEDFNTDACTNPCQAGYIPDRSGTCVDQFPACGNPPAHSAPSSCIDKVEVGGSISENYSFNCEDGYHKVGFQCLAN